MEWFGAGFACGGTTFSFLWWRIWRRTALRHAQVSRLELISNDLERRREAIEFGRESEVVSGSGPPAEVGGLWSVHPGAHYLSHLNTTEQLDSQQFSTTLDDGSQDQNDIDTDGR